MLNGITVNARQGEAGVLYYVEVGRFPRANDLLCYTVNVGDDPDANRVEAERIALHIRRMLEAWLGTC